MVLNQMKDIKLAAFKSLYIQRVEKKFEHPPVLADRHALAIVSGTYTTGKYRIAQTLSRFGRKDTAYHIFHIPYENLFKRMELSTFMDMLEEFISEAPQAEKRLFIVVVPAWLSAAEAIPNLN